MRNHTSDGFLDVIRSETDALRRSDLDPIRFAIEAIRLNIVAACYKDEQLLLDAMRRLQSLNESQIPPDWRSTK